MCTTCGCGHEGTSIDGHEHGPERAHERGHDHGPDHSHAPGVEAARALRIERDILAKNAAYAEANRERLAGQGTLALNLMSSPGSGKTTLLVETLKRLRGHFALAVIEGDQQTSRDAERIRATGAPAVQVNTGKGCHLDAHMVGHALERLPTLAQGVVFIENVGNLVCPAAFDLGEAHKVVVLSITEGDDKPLKYPDMFRAARVVVLNKIDLLPYVDFDPNACREHLRRINPDAEVLGVSARSGEGLEHWLEWIVVERAAALRAEMTALNAQLA